MGEHTIREILKRRSAETQRAMQRRRELDGGSGSSGGLLAKLILLVVVLGLLGYVGYLGWTAHAAGNDFAARKAERMRSGPLTLTGTTEFLPNTLLGSLHPAVYSPSGT